MSSLYVRLQPYMFVRLLLDIARCSCIEHTMNDTCNKFELGHVTCVEQSNMASEIGVNMPLVAYVRSL